MMKGAFVQVVSPTSGQIPNVVIFQFNPDTMRHTWSNGAAPAAGVASNPLATAGMPGETFSFSLSMDATDQGPAPHGGLFGRIATLEMLLHPTSIQELINGIAGISGGRTTPGAELPVILFVWGPTRIVPVRLTSLTITEKLYDDKLCPIHADAQIELRVITPEELASAGALGVLARAAYVYTATLRVAATGANLGGTAADLIGMVADAIRP